MNLKKTLDSGVSLEITMAPFAVGHSLFKAVMREIKDVEIMKEADVINLMKDIAAGILASEEIEKVLWDCMARSTYNNIKITPELFEDERVREDYLVVAKEVLWYNLSPFFKNLGSLLLDMQGKVSSIQRPELKKTKP